MDVLGELVGESAKIVALRQKVRALLQRHKGAGRLPPILIQGETGAGKGLLARLMHRAGPRANAPFVDLNCAAIPEMLLEAELFGYERGAFTDARQSKPGLFQTAHGGTLFLDEVGLLPRALQAKLLTVLEQGSVRRLGATKNEPANVSIVAATNEPLLSAVAAGRFREDLYHRLAVLTLEVPPLRERQEDIELLAERFLGHVCTEYNVPVKTLGADARAALRAYHWPGNVRELANVIERTVLLSDTETITAAELDLPQRAAAEPHGGDQTADVHETNRLRLAEALDRTSWNITRTAALLGITRNTVRARIRQYGLRPPATVDSKVSPSAESLGAPSDAVNASAEQALREVFEELRWERRRITFLRARVLAGPETPSSVTIRILGRIAEKIQTFGGHVTGVGQQDIVGIFGHEPAEDSPRRAASTAIAIVKVLEQERRSGILPADVAVTTAIHLEQVGLARIGRRPIIDEDAFREVSVVLGQLASVAEGEIVVSDAAASFLVRHFDVRRPTSAAAHRLIQRWSAAGGSQPVAFIGRRPEIELLHRLLDRAMLGQGQIVTIVGEPGIGKSRLLHEFQQSIRTQDVIALEGRCASYGSHVAYFPVMEILQTICHVDEAEPGETGDAKVLAALRQLGDAAVASAPYLQQLLFPRAGREAIDRSPDVIRARTFEAIRRVVLAEQERTTVLLIIEDLQWIDQTSQELLASVAGIVNGTRILMVTTCRPGYHAAWMAQSNATQVAIGPLSAPESRQLVESMLGARPDADALVTRVLSRGEGNPFFLEELARSVLERNEEPSPPAVPATVHDVLAGRIESLADTDRRALHSAAVIGREIALSLLREVSGLSDTDLHGCLGRLTGGEFLSATRFGADAEYTFKHTLTHDVAYDSVPEDVRSRLHARVAVAIQKLAPETGERRPEILARHYARAGRQAEAIDYWCRAGQLAIQRSAHSDAIVLLLQALELLAAQPDGAERAAREVTAQLAMATALTAARGYAAPELERTLSRILTLTGQLTDAAQEFSIRWSLWRFQLTRADFRAAEELASRLLELAAGQDDPARVAAHVAAGVDKFYLGDFAAAQEHFTQTLAIYDRAQAREQTLRFGQDLGVAAWGFSGWAGAVVGDLAGAAERAQQALQLARDIRHPFSLALALLCACEIHELRHEVGVVGALGDELIALSREHSFTFFSAIGLTHSGRARRTSGDVRGGLAMMREGADLYRVVGQRVGLLHRARLAEGIIASGAVEDGLTVIADALEQARHTNEQAFVSVHLTLKGEALIRRGDLNGAQAALREAVDLACRQGAWLFALRAACALARLDARSLEVLDGIARRLPQTFDSSDLRTARALLGRGS